MSTQTLVRSLIITLSLFCGEQLFAQQKIVSGTVIDANSEEAVPFASVVFKGTTIGKLTDSAGHFEFVLSNWPGDTLEITCVGYQPFPIIIDHNRESYSVTIRLERGTFSEGATVKVKVNKGLLVWRKIVQHKPENDRYRFDNFSYELDNRLELDLKNINFEKLGKFKPLKSISDVINQNIDTAEGLRYLPAYLTETISDYYVQKKPKKRREVIKAEMIAGGVKNESLVKRLGGMSQVVNVYDNYIPVFDKKFISPISDNGDYYYNYRIVDTQMIANSRYYHMVFSPRRTGGDLFEGDCWVQVGTFAIQKMSLRLGKEANVNFVDNLSLINEFRMINDSTWFLYKDKFVVDLSGVGKNGPGCIGRKTSTYEHVVVNDTSVTNELAKNKELEEVIVSPDAHDRNKAYWDSTRHEPLNRNEAGIIKMIDTLINAPAFKRISRTITFLGTGYLDVGNYQIGPWFNWISSNSWEGFRMRFDLGTNKYFNKKIRLHSYLAYGFLDKKLKGMGEIFYLPKKSPRMYLYGSYSNDLDFGQSYYGNVSSDNVFAFAVRKNNVAIKTVNVEEERFEFFREYTSWMSNSISITHRATTALRNLLPADSFQIQTGNHAFNNFEVALRFRFAYLERFVESHFYRSSLGSPYPIGELNIAHAFKGVFNSGHSYTKISVRVFDYKTIPPFGNISWMVYGGRTFGTLPYMYLDIAPGNELYYYDPDAFNMMNRWEFIHDKYVGANFEHNIGNGIFRLIPKLKFRQFWTAKAIWGWLSDENKQLNFRKVSPFQTLDGKTYLELGTGIDNIFHVLRVDFIWRVTPKSLPKEGDKQFGIFGSAHFTF